MTKTSIVLKAVNPEGAVPDQTPAKEPGATSAFMISVPTTCSAASSVSAMPTRLSLAPNLKAFCVLLTIFCTPEASLDSSLANLTNRQVQKLDINENMAPALAKRNPDANAASGCVAVDGAETLANARTTALIVVRMTWHHQESQPTRHNANARLFPGSVARAICLAEAILAAAPGQEERNSVVQVAHRAREAADVVERRADALMDEAVEKKEKSEALLEEATEQRDESEALRKESQ